MKSSFERRYLVPSSPHNNARLSFARYIQPDIFSIWENTHTSLPWPKHGRGRGKCVTDQTLKFFVSKLSSVSLIVRLISPLNPGTIQRKGFFWPPFCDIIILFSSATPSLGKDYDIALFWKLYLCEEREQIFGPDPSLPEFRINPYKLPKARENASDPVVIRFILPSNWLRILYEFSRPINRNSIFFVNKYPLKMTMQSHQNWTWKDFLSPN